MDNNEEKRRYSSSDRRHEILRITPYSPDLGKLSDKQLKALETELKATIIAGKSADKFHTAHRQLSRALLEIVWRRLLSEKHERVETRRILLPPRLFYDGLLRRFLRPAAYKRYIVPHIADMHEEYFSCLSKNDEAGARWAIIRGHLYVIPSWVWSLLGQLLARVLGKRI
ncbi:MAG TPA: hypothetical protein VNR40_14865 [Steroidobacter sp.]|nr:hypothetical protein [Steroidobacter sp.]